MNRLLMDDGEEACSFQQGEEGGAKEGKGAPSALQ